MLFLVCECCGNDPPRPDSGRVLCTQKKRGRNCSPNRAPVKSCCAIRANNSALPPVFTPISHRVPLHAPAFFSGAFILVGVSYHTPFLRLNRQKPHGAFCGCPETCERGRLLAVGCFSLAAHFIPLRLGRLTGLIRCVPFGSGTPFYRTFARFVSTVSNVPH